MTLGVAALQDLSFLELNARLRTAGQGGFVFDRYGDQDYKFVLVDAVADKVLIGHRTARGIVIDASVSRPVDAGVDFTLTATLKGSTVAVALNGQTVLSHAFNAVVVDGQFGLLTRGGASSFDSVTLKTNDTRLATPAAQLLASEAAVPGEPVHTLQSGDVAPLLQEAIRRWSVTAGTDVAQSLDGVEVSIVDLPGLELAAYDNGRIFIDVDAAGHGWFIDRTPGDDREYTGGGEVLVAPHGAASGRMDLLSVLEHELGHAAGLDHADDGVMAQTLHGRHPDDERA